MSRPPLTNSEEHTPFSTWPFSIVEIHSSAKLRQSALIGTNRESEACRRSSEEERSSVWGASRFPGKFGRESEGTLKMGVKGG
jgi:predicted FMN-binding regulatory protein PaiB